MVLALVPRFFTSLWCAKPCFLKLLFWSFNSIKGFLGLWRSGHCLSFSEKKECKFCGDWFFSPFMQVFLFLFYHLSARLKNTQKLLVMQARKTTMIRFFFYSFHSDLLEILVSFSCSNMLSISFVYHCS